MNGRQVFAAVAIVLLTLLLAYVLYRAGVTLIVLFLAIVFASTIRPVVDRLARWRVPRGLAIILVYVGLLLGLAGLLIVAIPPLVGLTVQLLEGDLLIEQVRALVAQLAVFGWNQFRIVLPVFVLPEQIQELLGEAGETVQQQAWPLARNTFTVLGQIALIFIMCFYWLTARERLLDLLLRVSPLRHRARIELIWNDVEETLGAYTRSQFILVLVVGLAALVGLLLLRVPYAPALAVIAGLTEAIPMVGPFLGAAPAVLVALTVSPLTALLVAGWYLLIQQLENNVLVPKIMEQQVGLNPLLVIIALVVGGSLGGIVGALLAVPLAGALQVIARHLLVEPAIQSNLPHVEEGGAVLLDYVEPAAPPPGETADEARAGRGRPEGQANERSQERSREQP